MARRALLCLCLLAISVAALPAAAVAKTHATKRPVVTLVSPMRLGLGDTLTIRGRNFNKRSSRDTVSFKSPNGRSIFAKPIRASRKLIVVKIPAALRDLFAAHSGTPVATRFTLQVFANGQRSATLRRLSPVVVPPATPKPAAPKKTSGGKKTGGTAPVAPPASAAACGTGNDWDGDLLSNSLEAQLGTDPCKKDTDGDGVEDGFEYKSAIDLNDDDFQDPNTSLPYPGKRPYPNPLDGSDGNVDYDGDSLTSLEEQKLWKYTIAQGATATLFPLTYSAGEQYSMSTRGANGRRVPTLAAAGYQKQQDFLNWATAHGYRQVMLPTGPPWHPWYDQAHQQLFGILDMNRDGSESPPPPAGSYWFSEQEYYDIRPDGWLSDNERDEDGDGLTNFDESHGRTSSQGWWTSCYKDAGEGPFPVNYAGTDMTNPDTDGDGILDGADDIDHDDIPNVMELSRNAASGFDDTGGKGWCHLEDNSPDDPARGGNYGRVNPFNPCLPDPLSRTCPQYVDFGTPPPAPFDGSKNWFSLN